MNLSDLKLVNSGATQQKASVQLGTVPQGEKVLLQHWADLVNQRFAMTGRKGDERIIATQKSEESF